MEHDSIELIISKFKDVNDRLDRIEAGLCDNVECRKTVDSLKLQTKWQWGTITMILSAVGAFFMLLYSHVSGGK